MFNWREHRRRKYPKIARLCACGCGASFKSGYDFRLKRYSQFVAGHNEVRVVVPRAVLEAMYFVGQLNQDQLARWWGVSRTTIKKWFREYKLQGRSQSERRTGKRNPLWKGGGYSGFRGEGWALIVKRVRARDKACRDCGRTPKQLGRQLDVHHKVPWRCTHDNAMTNLVGLCRRCHRLADTAFSMAEKGKGIISQIFGGFKKGG